MLIAATRLKNLPLVDPDTHERIGIVLSCIFDPDRPRLLAISMKPSGLLTQPHYIVATDIESYEEHAILCDKSNISTLNDIPKIVAVIHEKRRLLGVSAKTTGGKNLGRVIEIMFDDSTNAVTQIHTQRIFTRQIFLPDHIVRVTRSAVVFSDDNATIAEKEVTIPAEVTVAS